MRLTINGQDRSRTESCTVATLVAEIIAAQRGVAVAVNGTVVPRSAWNEVDLADGDRVEVLTAAQGG
ncbi:putative sulfur transfer protein [Actinoplanes missouriensis 431]|uniref:Putative sulfur transfer protein n=1 Tax=Actinoplanes missouriensis (strain ATCC 14538 / DSM 43046 / CBS 188.64 / JCM 3121 / NBRC 102363 / NCIMB 12654 / NRRL B-3342 / UNCC 431) TaxID=512565 RepID=I0GYM3_ACTM4|nr:sulfur carrier protein ThiS [Actinoplanes missouriensis]BAL85860.1 putative sulfur transfer protein [Actinoplanes missouriensis 431]